MGERPHEVWSVPPPVSIRLRPCCTAFLSILKLFSYQRYMKDFIGVLCITEFFRSLLTRPLPTDP